MNKLLTEDLLKQIRLMGYDRSKIQNEQNYFSLPKIILEQNWGTTNGDNQYWVDLYDKLKNAGLNVKYGANGKETNDPNAAKFMFFDYWTIWKDLNANDGYPIQIGNTGFQFKFKNSKYKGESINNTLIIPKQNKKKTLKLSDVVRINDTNKIKNIVSGFCDALRQRSTLGLDMVKMAEDKKKYSECFQQEWKDISKKDPLYKQKTEKFTPKATEKYGENITKWKNMSDQTDEARLERYKSASQVGKDMYDLVYLPELGKENYSKKIQNLKKEIETYGLGESKITSKEKELKNGYEIFKKALANRKKLKSVYNWTEPDVIKITEENLPLLSFILKETSLSTVIDPTFIEAIYWVNAKTEILRNQIKLLEKYKSWEDEYENAWRFKNNLNARKKEEKRFSAMKPETFTNKQTIGSKDAKNTTINLTNSYGEKISFSLGEQEKYKKDLKDFIKEKSSQETASYIISENSSYVDFSSQLMENLYQHNKSIAELKSEWIKTSNGVCDLFIEKPLNKKTTKENVVEFEKFNTVCGTELYGRYSLKNVCSNDQNQGLFIVKGSETNRIKDIGIDWKKLKLTYSTEKTPDNLICMCANQNIVDYQKVSVKGTVGVKCVTTTASTGGGAASESFHDLYESTFEVEPRQYMFQTKDVRGFHSKVFDWGKKCLTAANDEGEMGTDFHCVLDIASVVSVFIPVVGPIISMIIDVSNGLIYLVDALKAEPGMEKNMAYFSAGMSILGGLLTGIGDLRAMLKAQPNGAKILAFSDEFAKRGVKLATMSEDVALMESRKLVMELSSKYGLLSKELEMAQEYMGSLEKLMKESPKAVATYKKTIRQIQGKIGMRRWSEFMANKNFQEIMIKNNGNIVESIKIFSKKVTNKDFLIQVGFLVGGESVLPELTGSFFMDKIKSGEWGTFGQMLQSNNYNLESVVEEFMVDENYYERDMKLLEMAWKEKCGGDWKERCVDINGIGKPWRPSYPVPPKYRTEKYKKMFDDKTTNNNNIQSTNDALLDLLK